MVLKGTMNGIATLPDNIMKENEAELELSGTKNTRFLVYYWFWCVNKQLYGNKQKFD